MIWFRKHIPNIIFCVCFIWIILKWWTFGSNIWGSNFIDFLYALGFSLKIELIMNKLFISLIIGLIQGQIVDPETGQPAELRYDSGSENIIYLG